MPFPSGTLRVHQFLELIDSNISIGEMSDDVESAAHRFDVTPEGAHVEIGAMLDLGYFGLSGIERFSKRRLR